MPPEFLTKKMKLFLFSFLAVALCYGMGLTYHSLTVDSELPMTPDYSLSLGRWGTNLVRWHIFQGHLPYFTLLLGLALLSLSSVEMTRYLGIEGIKRYFFCLVFLTFPQMAYQLGFTMQADLVPLGFLCSVYVVLGFDRFMQSSSLAFKTLYLLGSALLLMFVIALYQALVFLPIILYIIRFFQQAHQAEFTSRKAIIQTLWFFGLLLLGMIFYYISVKLFCPPLEEGYLSSYLSGESNSHWGEFLDIWKRNLLGTFYYGENLFVIATVLGVATLIRIGMERHNWGWKLLALVMMFFVPFFFSAIITNGYHPPRLYVASGIVFAFLIVYWMDVLRSEKTGIIAIGFIFFTHTYYITNLYYENFKIFNHDLRVAHQIQNTIVNQYPDFDQYEDYVYFYGGLPNDHHDKFRLPNSDVFGGSILNWDRGNYFRIITFFDYNDIARYRLLDDQNKFDGIRQHLDTLPVWPKKGAIQKFGDVVIVKLNQERGNDYLK